MSCSCILFNSNTNIQTTLKTDATKLKKQLFKFIVFQNTNFT
jgi:hypothetical protein